MAVFRSVVFAGLFGMVCGVVEVAFRRMGMVCSLFMMASLIVFRGSEYGAASFLWNLEFSLPKDCDGSIDAW